MKEKNMNAKKMDMVSLTFEDLENVSGGQLIENWQNDVDGWVQSAKKNQWSKAKLMEDIQERWESHYGSQISSDYSDEDLESVLNYINNIC